MGHVVAPEILISHASRCPFALLEGDTSLASPGAVLLLHLSQTRADQRIVRW